MAGIPEQEFISSGGERLGLLCPRRHAMTDAAALEQEASGLGGSTANGSGCGSPRGMSGPRRVQLPARTGAKRFGCGHTCVSGGGPLGSATWKGWTNSTGCYDGPSGFLPVSKQCDPLSGRLTARAAAYRPSAAFLASSLKTRSQRTSCPRKGYTSRYATAGETGSAPPGADR